MRVVVVGRSKGSSCGLVSLFRGRSSSFDHGKVRRDRISSVRSIVSARSTAKVFRFGRSRSIFVGSRSARKGRNRIFRRRCRRRCRLYLVCSSGSSSSHSHGHGCYVYVVDARRARKGAIVVVGWILRPLLVVRRADETATASSALRLVGRAVASGMPARALRRRDARVSRLLRRPSQERERVVRDNRESRRQRARSGRVDR